MIQVIYLGRWTEINNDVYPRVVVLWLVFTFLLLLIYILIFTMDMLFYVFYKRGQKLYKSHGTEMYAFF